MSEIISTYQIDQIRAQEDKGFLIISMPRNAKPFAAAEVQGAIRLYSIISLREPHEPRRFCLLREGDVVPSDLKLASFVSTITSYRSSVVWFLFDLGQAQVLERKPQQISALDKGQRR